MNKKQLIAVWGIGVAIIVVIRRGGFHQLGELNVYSLAAGWHFVNKPEIRIISSLIILAVLLVYTLRDKRK
jgi:hypothetical protein